MIELIQGDNHIACKMELDNRIILSRIIGESTTLSSCIPKKVGGTKFERLHVL